MKRVITHLLVAIAIVLLWAGCRTAKPTVAEHASAFQRKPITEVTQQQLELDNMLITAKTQQLTGNDEAALKSFRQLLAKEPTNAAVLHEMGRIMEQYGSHDSALHYYQRAVEADANNVWYKLSLANVYEFQHNGRNLVATWETIVKQQPEVIEHYYDLSNAYLLNNDAVGAIDALNRLEKKIGVTEPISLQKKRLWEAIGRPDKAQKEIEALANAMPQETRYNAMLAELFMQQKNYVKAKSYYDRIAAADPSDEYIHISLANYYKLTNQPDKAFAEMKTAFLNPRLDGKSKLQILGSFYTDEEFYGSCSQQAFELLDIAMSQCNDSLSYALFYGDVLMRQEKYADAARQFRLHLTADSSRYEVWEALLICESEIEGHEDVVLHYAQRAEKLFPLHTLPYYLQAAVIGMRGNHSEALRLLQQCEKIGFNKGYLEAETYALLAETHHALQHPTETYYYCDKFLQLHPDDIHILNNYAYYLAEANERLADALAMSARTIKQEPKNSTFLDTYAWVLYKLGRYAEALQYMEQAIANSEAPSDTLQQHLKAIQQALQK